MIIGKLAMIVDLQAGIKAAFIFVALLAVGNAAGRIIAGLLSDKIGRTWTMFAVFVFQAILMFLLRGLDNYSTLFLASVLIGFILTWDNILNMFLQAWVGSRSDRTHTRLGRRKRVADPRRAHRRALLHGRAVRARQFRVDRAGDPGLELRHAGSARAGPTLPYTSPRCLAKPG